MTELWLSFYKEIEDIAFEIKSAKINGAYYQDVLFSQNVLQLSSIRSIAAETSTFQQDCV